MKSVRRGFTTRPIGKGTHWAAMQDEIHKGIDTVKTRQRLEYGAVCHGASGISAWHERLGAFFNRESKEVVKTSTAQ